MRYGCSIGAVAEGNTMRLVAFVSILAAPLTAAAQGWYGTIGTDGVIDFERRATPELASIAPAALEPWQPLAAWMAREPLAPPYGMQTNRSIAERFAAIESAVQRAAEHFVIPAWLIRAVIHHESRGDPNATSSRGAMGLMQLMPETARHLGVQRPYDPEENIMAGTRLLRELLDEWGGSLSLALAAYSAGSGAVRRYGGVPPFAETQEYVSWILANGRRFNTPPTS